MDSIFKICKNGACGITISGLEKDNDEYLNEEDIIISTRNYAYSHTITLNVLTSIQSNGTESTKEIDIVLHEVDCIDESDMEMPIDGLYKISHIILPTEVWLKYILDRDVSALSAYNLIYIYNESLKTFQKYTNSALVDIDIEEILSINAVPPINITDKTSTIIRGDKNTFCTCYINECFYKLCTNLLTVLPNKCYNKLDDIKSLIYNRDIIWMTLNVIKYLLELKQFYEAQRILEETTFCGGVCKDIVKKSLNGNSCGCNN